MVVMAFFFCYGLIMIINPGVFVVVVVVVVFVVVVVGVVASSYYDYADDADEEGSPAKSTSFCS